MATFRVWAAMETYCYLDVEANSATEAMAIAEYTDGGEFIEDPDPYSGDFRVIEAYRLKEPPTEI